MCVCVCLIDWIILVERIMAAFVIERFSVERMGVCVDYASCCGISSLLVIKL